MIVKPAKCVKHACDSSTQYKVYMQEIVNSFPWVNNALFVCPKLAMVYEICHIRYKSMGTIMKAVTLVVCNAKIS